MTSSKIDSKKSAKIKTETRATDCVDRTVEVLYQRLGNRWYAFSMINDELFVGTLTEDELMNQKSNLQLRRASFGT